MANKKTTAKSKTKKTTAKKTVKTAAVSRQTSMNQKLRIASLKRWNIIIAVLLGLQALAVLVIGKASTLPVVSHYLAKDSLASQVAGHTILSPAVRQMFAIDIRYIVVAYLLVSTLIHWLIASIRRENYEHELQKHLNTLRWVDYGISSGIMLILIAMLNGAYDASLLLAIFVLVAILHFLAYFGEAKAIDFRARMQTFAGLCVAGTAVWLIVASYLKGALFYGQGLSHFVYWIDGGIFVLTLGLAYNKLQVLRGQGKWADYIFGERIFMALSFGAKTLLTWLVFAGFLK
ncbi:MAG: heliorhodopsin HeR [Candidatus Saccharimonadales bacterium]